jgi:crotonobetainyl-CoA:carnitine CoA-transferase CaiB-like acyl-CoA transferase
MLDVALMLQGNRVTDYLRTGKHPQRGDQRPFAANSAYETKDGIIQLACSNLRQQSRFFESIGMPDRAVRNSYEDSKAQYDTEWKLVAQKMQEKTAAEWEAYLQAHHVPAAQVREMRDALKDPQLQTRRVLHQHDKVAGAEAVNVPLAAFKFAHDGPAIDSVPPRVGEHTDEVLAIAGYGAEQIKSMRKAGVVA